MGDAAVEVVTTARLHMGFLDLDGALGRRFGSVGLSLDRPATTLAVSRADAPAPAGPPTAPPLGGGGGSPPPPGGSHVVRVRDAMPAHAGLGSGTQLALAVATALRRLHGLPIDSRADASLLGRGRRSGIGLGLFEHGGLVVDGGPGPDGALPPLLARLPLPPHWRVVLVIDPTPAGLSGHPEAEAFAHQPPMRPSDPGALCRLLVMQLLPALAEDDLARFGDAVTRMQELLGDHFAQAQGGGRFSSALVGAAVSALRERGCTGLGQTSWGPTGFAFTRGDLPAQRIAAELAASAELRGLDFLVCRTLNRGASVAVVGAA